MNSTYKLKGKDYPQLALDGSEALVFDLDQGDDLCSYKLSREALEDLDCATGVRDEANLKAIFQKHFPRILMVASSRFYPGGHVLLQTSDFR